MVKSLAVGAPIGNKDAETAELQNGPEDCRDKMACLIRTQVVSVGLPSLSSGACRSRSVGLEIETPARPLDPARIAGISC